MRGYGQCLRWTEPEIIDGDDDEEGQQYEKYGHDALGVAESPISDQATATKQRARQ